MNIDEIDPPIRIETPIKLEEMSIHELEDHVLAMEQEITKTKEIIDKKKAHKEGIESLFKAG